MQITPAPLADITRVLERLRATRPLVHCLTNEVVQEITANVLLAAGASPAMVVALGEAPDFTRLSGGLLINVGTPVRERLAVMQACAITARKAQIPWILDPVAAGVLAWRDTEIQKLVALRPNVIRGNASEILALTGLGTGGKGVDSTDSSDAALEASVTLAKNTGGVVCVTGEKDFVTDGSRIYAVSGGHPMATLVVGTGCSLSALVAAFCAVEKDHVLATAAACALAKRAAEIAFQRSRGPGSFHTEYLDALYLMTSQRLSGEVQC